MTKYSSLLEQELSFVSEQAEEGEVSHPSAQEVVSILQEVNGALEQEATKGKLAKVWNAIKKYKLPIAIGAILVAALGYIAIRIVKNRKKTFLSRTVKSIFEKAKGLLAKIGIKKKSALEKVNFISVSLVLAFVVAVAIVAYYVWSTKTAAVEESVLLVEEEEKKKNKEGFFKTVTKTVSTLGKGIWEAVRNFFVRVWAAIKDAWRQSWVTVVIIAALVVGAIVGVVILYKRYKVKKGTVTEQIGDVQDVGVAKAIYQKIVSSATTTYVLIGLVIVLIVALGYFIYKYNKIKGDAAKNGRAIENALKKTMGIDVKEEKAISSLMSEFARKAATDTELAKKLAKSLQEEGFAQAQAADIVIALVPLYAQGQK